MEPLELGAVAEVDGQRGWAVCGAPVLFEQVFDGGQSGGGALESLGDGCIEGGRAVEVEQPFEARDQAGRASGARKSGLEKAFEAQVGRSAEASRPLW